MLISEKEQLMKELKSLRLSDRTADEKRDIRQRIVQLQREIEGNFCPLMFVPAVYRNPVCLRWLNIEFCELLGTLVTLRSVKYNMLVLLIVGLVSVITAKAED